jgi:hypothetical protein
MNPTKLMQLLGTTKPPPTKAKQGQKCAQCGTCCSAQICEIGQMSHPGAKPPCPSLGFSKKLNKFGCQLVSLESRLLKENKLAKAIGIGQGCGAPDKGSEPKPKNGPNQKKQAKKPKAKGAINGKNHNTRPPKPKAKKTAAKHQAPIKRTTK